MNRKHLIANSILWAAAIVAAALLHAPVFLSFALLPALATTSLLLTLPEPRGRVCIA